MKKCLNCQIPLQKRVGRVGGQKTCSYECRKENLAKWYEVVVKKRCRRCSAYFEVKRKNRAHRKYCYTCTGMVLAEQKSGARNPNWVGGKSNWKKPIYSLKMRRHNYVCRQFRKKFALKHGYGFCEVCKRSDNGSVIFDTHHLYYASHYPKNENLHHPQNLILVCRSCHQKFHNGEYRVLFLTLEEERGLKELFVKGLNVSDPPVFDYGFVNVP